MLDLAPGGVTANFCTAHTLNEYLNLEGPTRPFAFYSKPEEISPEYLKI